MLCPACGVTAPGLCERCVRTLRPAPIRMVAGIPVVGGYAHRGAAVALVHRMKYRRDSAAAAILIERVVACLGNRPTAIVPIPRAWTRRLRYGVDPGLVLAVGVGERLRVPVIQALATPIWMSRHTGKHRSERDRRRFAVVRHPPDDTLLIDDVLTSGSTIAAALSALDRSQLAVATATTAGTMG